MLEALRERVDRELAAFLSVERARAERTAGPDVGLLFDELSRILGAGGKRFRPAFCYWGHRAAGGDDTSALIRAGGALELLHTFALVHDDVIDRAPTRRGVRSVHASLASVAPGGDGAAFGTSAAILVGDLAFALGVRLFEESGFSRVRLRAAAAWIHPMGTEAIAGEFLDLLAAHRPEVDERAAVVVALLKSASYSVQKPLLVGAALARRRDPRVAAALSRYGAYVGLAFQLRDDVLGSFGSPGTTGKDADSDLADGKRTFLLARALARASDPERRGALDRLASPARSGADVEALRGLIRSSGSLAEHEALIAALTADGLAALEDAPIEEPARSALADLAPRATRREA